VIVLFGFCLYISVLIIIVKYVFLFVMFYLTVDVRYIFDPLENEKVLYPVMLSVLHL